VIFPKLHDFISRTWKTDVMPALVEYVAIPCESPAFDPDWATHGHMHRAVDLLVRWAREHLAELPGATVDVITASERTPAIFIDVPGTASASVLIYGHLDKQPAMDGWAAGRSAWVPTIEGNRLYGRGGADDGYSLFSAVTAVLALRDQRADCPRCMILIEACEESGSIDLPYYMERLAPRVGVPAVVIALDASCGNYEQLWMTTSLRGQVAGTLMVQVLREGIHSGDASGVVPSSFRIVRQILSRVESEETGEVIPRDFHVHIPQQRRCEAEQAATTLGAAFHEQLPLRAGVTPVTDDLTELLLNRTWRPQLTITGLDGLPGIAAASAVMHPQAAVKVSLRLPPTLDAQSAAQRLKILLETNPPYGADVSFTIELVSHGWHAPPLAPWLQASAHKASLQAFGAPSAFIGGGGGIPFLAMLGERFPDAQVITTGVLGPESNAHGPNEFLHLPTAIRLTAVVAQLLHDASDAGAKAANRESSRVAAGALGDRLQSMTLSIAGQERP
jgi:acetylornithine deacetylase/succinyl-diaminopimelate desuccinylase-like protein